MLSFIYIYIYIYIYGIINFDTLLHLVGFFCMNCILIHGFTNINFTNVWKSRNWRTPESHNFLLPTVIIKNKAKSQTSEMGVT
jgi:hypothetical protein